MARYHQKKEISKAIEYALSCGFRIVEAGRSGHAALILYCPEASREGHFMSVWSTPRDAHNHADDIRRWVDNDPHKITPP